MLASISLHTNQEDSYVLIINLDNGEVVHELLYHCKINFNKEIDLIPNGPTFFEGRCSSYKNENTSLFILNDKKVKNVGTISEYVDYEDGYYESTHNYEDSGNNNFQIIEKGKDYPDYFSEGEVFVRLYKWNSAQEVFEEIDNADFPINPS